MQSITLYPAKTAATSVTTATTPLFLGDEKYFAIQAVFSGTDVAGTFKLQASVDNVNWADISGASTSVTASATTVLSGAGVGYPYVRFQWSYSSGTGNLTVYAVIKQNQVYD